MTDFLHLSRRKPVQRPSDPVSFALTPLLRDAPQQSPAAASLRRTSFWKSASLTLTDASAGT
ncbi:MAG: hypothetical protein ACREPZ_06700 [Rhodanobacteraceae bacterium]